MHHSLWADHPDDEKRIWTELLRVISEITNPVLTHYGTYETTFLKQMRRRHGGPAEGTVAANAIHSAVNLLSIIFAQVYFPAYSNGLKDVAAGLGFSGGSQPLPMDGGAKSFPLAAAPFRLGLADLGLAWLLSRRELCYGRFQGTRQICFSTCFYLHPAPSLK